MWVLFLYLEDSGWNIRKCPEFEIRGPWALGQRTVNCWNPQYFLRNSDFYLPVITELWEVQEIKPIINNVYWLLHIRPNTWHLLFISTTQSYEVGHYIYFMDSISEWWCDLTKVMWLVIGMARAQPWSQPFWYSQ